MRVVTILGIVLALGACGPAGRDNRGGDRGQNTCPRPCADACCGTNEACNEATGVCEPCLPRTCQTAGAVCGEVSDGCGGTLECGGCPSGHTCSQNSCVPGGACVPLTCADFEATCGELPDGCGGTLSCGTCADGETCGGAGPWRCGTGQCQGESDLAMCQRLGRQCGSVVEFDNCGNSRQIASCGGCQTHQECRENKCVCVPEDEWELCAGFECGSHTVTDRCGKPRQISCGECPTQIGDACSSSSCTGEGQFCLPEFPGGYCMQPCDGICPAGSTCVPANQSVHVCLKSCAGSADCRDEYKCANGVCVPDVPTGARYEACGTTVATCEETDYCVRLTMQHVVGACYGPCTDGSCPDGQVCSQDTFCVPTCDGSRPCPGVTKCDTDGRCWPPDH